MSDDPKKPGGRRALGATVEPEDPVQATGDKREKRLLPDHCPCVPLGYDGQYLFVLDRMGQLHKLNSDKLGHGILLNTCSPEWLYDNYPRKKKIIGRAGEIEWITTGWRVQDYQADLDNSCKEAGPFDADEDVRGRGCYAGESGLILHLGDRVMMGGKRRGNGRIGRYVYPHHKQALPAPVAFQVDAEPGAALLHAIINGGWNFNRAIDAWLILGMIGVVVLGGALPVRPGCALTGDRGTGKTELMNLLRHVLGSWLGYATDTTEAGLRQAFGRDATGMLLDEQESAGDGAFKRIFLYWRSSFGGGMTLRGGASHAGTSFVAKGTIIVAAINLPTPEPQDRSRIIQVMFLPLGDTRGKPRLIHDKLWPGEGLKIIRRLIDQHPAIVRDIIPAWRELLIDAGWDNRGADTYGTVLGCAWAICRDGAPTTQDFDRFADDMALLRDAHMADEIATYRQVLGILYGWRTEQFRKGEIRGLGEYVMQAAGWGLGEPTEEGLEFPEQGSASNIRTEREASLASVRADARKANQFIHRFGIHIFRARDDDPRGEWKTGERLIGFASQCPQLGEVFRGTPWAATGSGQGGWGNALLRAPTARRWALPVRFPYGGSRIIAMRLDVALAGMVGPDGGEAAESWQQTARTPESSAPIPAI